MTQSDPAKVQAFVGSHPKALAFVQAITPLPASFAKEKYFGLTAMKFTNKDGAHEQKQIIFDPIPRLDGIEPSDDPLLELRAAVYLISGRRRRTAPEQLTPPKTRRPLISEVPPKP